MIWLYAFIGVCAAFITSGLFHLLFKRKKTPAWLFAVVILLAVTIAQEFSAPYYHTLMLEYTIKHEDPLFVLLAEKSPLEFKVYLTAMQKNVLLGKNQNNGLYSTSEFVNSSVTKYAQHASNASLFHYLQITVTFYKKLAAINPALVLKMEFPAKFTDRSDFNQLGSAYTDSFKQILAAKRLIIQSAINDPQPTLSEADNETAKALLRQVIVALSDKYGTENVVAAFQRPDDPSIDKNTAAAIIIGLYNDILVLGKTDTGLVLKYIFSAGSKE